MVAITFVSVGVGEAALIIDPVGGTVSNPIHGPTIFFKAPWAGTVHIQYARDSIGMWGDRLAICLV